MFDSKKIAPSDRVPIPRSDSTTVIPHISIRIIHFTIHPHLLRLLAAPGYMKHWIWRVLVPEVDCWNHDRGRKSRVSLTRYRSYILMPTFLHTRERLVDVVTYLCLACLWTLWTDRKGCSVVQILFCIVAKKYAMQGVRLLMGKSLEGFLAWQGWLRGEETWLWYPSY